MKNYFWMMILWILASKSVFCQLPSNFDNQQLLLNVIQENIDLITNLTQNIINNPSENSQMRSDMVTSVLKKDQCADQIAEILCKSFLQKYILDSDPEVAIKLAVVHKMLNLCFLLKTKVDMDLVKSLESNLNDFKERMKLNYQTDAEYKPLKYRKYIPSKKN